MNITFATPLAGFNPLHDYTLTPVNGATGVYSLQSVDRPEIRFHVLDTEVHHPTYRADIAVSDEHTVYAITTAGRNGLTVNLLAPVIVNRLDGTAEQTILSDADRYPVNAALADLVAA